MGKLRYSGRLILDFLQFAKEHKAYWIIPLMVILVLTIAVIVLGQTALPFIYTLF